MVVLSPDAVSQSWVRLHQAGPVPDPACPVGAVLPVLLQEGNADLALLADPQPELGVHGVGAVVPAAPRRLSPHPGAVQLLGMAQHPVCGEGRTHIGHRFEPASIGFPSWLI